MKTRIVRKPKTYRSPNPPNRAGVTTPGPLRFETGARQGRPVPTRRGVVKQIVCVRCELPSHKGLPPFVKALGFDHETGAAIEQYVHVRCPKAVVTNKRMIAEFARDNAATENARRSVTYGRHGPKGFVKVPT